MIIAEQKKRKNIAEYVLYMWQIEDIIRGFRLDITQIEHHIIEKFQVNDELKSRIKSWYLNLIDKLRQEDKISTGHLQENTLIINDLEGIHKKLLNSQQKEYIDYYNKVKQDIDAFRAKSTINSDSDIYICFCGLYSQLLLNLKKQTITEQTQEAFRSFSRLIAYLAGEYHKNVL